MSKDTFARFQAKPLDKKKKKYYNKKSLKKVIDKWLISSVGRATDS